jgi:predicted phosphodiesterase
MKQRSALSKWSGIFLLCVTIIGLFVLLSVTIFKPQPLTEIQPTLVIKTGTLSPVPSSTVTFTKTPAPTSTATFEPIHYSSIDFRKGPYLIFTGDSTQMEVVWQLEKTTPSIIEWGTTDQYQNGNATTTEYTSDHMYRFIVPNLKPATKYYFRVIVGDGESTGSFLTAPESTASDLKFFIYGDTRDGTAIHDQIAGWIIETYKADPASQTFILATGDLVDTGDLEWMWDKQLFDPLYRKIRTVIANLAFLPVVGNHDGNGTLFMKYFPMPFIAQPYWSFDYGPVHVAMLDQYVPFEEGSDQYAWLNNDLAASTKTWKFIVMHMPGWSASEDNLDVQRSIVSLAEKNGVSVIFAGHNHYYARAEVNGVTHITAGGGGAPLYVPNPKAPNVVAASMTHSFVEISIHGNTLDGIAFDIDGNVIDSFSINK